MWFFSSKYSWKLHISIYSWKKTDLRAVNIAWRIILQSRFIYVKDSRLWATETSAFSNKENKDFMPTPMTWNQFLNINSWCSFVSILLLKFLIVYGWQYAPCKVICQFSRTQLPVNCGLRWGEYVALPRPSHLHEEHCFWESGIPVPNAQAKMRYVNERGEDDMVVSGTWLCHRDVELLWVPWAAHEEHRCPAYIAKDTIFKCLYTRICGRKQPQALISESNRAQDSHATFALRKLSYSKHMLWLVMGY